MSEEEKLAFIILSVIRNMRAMDKDLDEILGTVEDFCGEALGLEIE